jgi:hypothetical protein
MAGIARTMKRDGFHCETLSWITWANAGYGVALPPVTPYTSPVT